MNRQYFGLISEIDVADPDTWQHRAFITLDIDWAPDYIVSDVMALFIKEEIQATWFTTHPTDFNTLIREHPLFELGPHPNFNPLLNLGSPEKGSTADEIISEAMTYAPGAVAVRSHCLTQSSSVTELFVRHGLKFELNTFIPLSAGFALKPFLHCNGLTVVPHVWEDDVHMITRESYDQVLLSLESYTGLRVFDFHPIHVYLNCENLHRYEKVKARMDNKALADSLIYEGYGTRSFLEEVIRRSRSLPETPRRSLSR